MVTKKKKLRVGSRVYIAWQPSRIVGATVTDVWDDKWDHVRIRLDPLYPEQPEQYEILVAAERLVDPPA